MSGPLTWCFGLLVMACQPPEPPKTTTVVCAPKIEWTAAEQKAAAAELEKLPAGNPLRRMAVVTVKQRQVIDACHRAKAKR